MKKVTVRKAMASTLVTALVLTGVGVNSNVADAATKTTQVAKKKFDYKKYRAKQTKVVASYGSTLFHMGNLGGIKGRGDQTLPQAGQPGLCGKDIACLVLVQNGGRYCCLDGSHHHRHDQSLCPSFPEVKSQRPNAGHRAWVDLAAAQGLAPV